MRTSFLELLGRSWDHTVRILFRPFDPVKWLVLGFAAWLAGLTSWNNGSGGTSNPGTDIATGIDEVDGENLAEALTSAWDYLHTHTLWLIAIVGVMLVVMALIVLLTWISSRGKFIFLDGVLRNEARIVEPWGRFRTLGDSLFMFRFVLGWIVFGVGLVLAGGSMWLVLGEVGFTESTPWPSAWPSWPLWIGLGVSAAIFFVLSLAVNFALDAFIVPIMYRRGLTTMEAWSYFLPLLGAHTGRFILFTVLIFLITILVFSFVVIFGFMTCCVGFVLLALPYIGTLLLLPVLVTYRTFTAMFLADVDPTLDFFPTSGPAPDPDLDLAVPDPANGSAL